MEARSVTIRYGDLVAVDAVSLSARPGEVLAILGANGSGKSSLLRALAGVQRYEGSIDRATDAPVGYMPQDNAARAALTAFEVVLLGRLRSLALRVGERDLEAARDALAELGVAHLASQRIGELSGGQRQLVFMAQVARVADRIVLMRAGQVVASGRPPDVFAAPVLRAAYGVDGQARITSRGSAERASYLLMPLSRRVGFSTRPLA